MASVVPVPVWNYGLASFDRTHVFKANWVWDVPKMPWRGEVADRILSNWQISGIASFISGAPLAVGYTLVNAVDTTGTPDQTARIVVTGNPVLPRGDRTFNRNFNTSVLFLPPQPGTTVSFRQACVRPGDLAC